jgi:glyoxylase-like metal-dependent hydrolase (beta-lactamase superfamily II)
MMGGVTLRALIPLLAAGVLATSVMARTQPSGTSSPDDAFRLTRVAEGVYHAVSTGVMPVGSNAVVIVNEEDVVLVDSHSTPSAAAALLRQVREITSKPVRVVINTHFHWDHAHGNQVYGTGVEIIGHDFTRRMLASGASRRGRSYDMFIGSLPSQIAQLRTRVAQTPEGPDRTTLQRQLASQERYLADTDAVVPTPPTTVVRGRLVLTRGSREIHLLFLGRGHTGGDLLVYLPRERVVATGDLLTAGPAYLGDGYFADWISTLDALRRLEFDTVVPGHGDAFAGKTRIDHFQAYLRDFLAQVRRLHAEGLSAEEAARRIDLRSHAEHYPTIREVGILSHGVYRAYDELDGRLSDPPGPQPW